MKWNEQTQQEARQLMETLSEQEWRTLVNVANALKTPPSPEQVKADQERREREQAMLEAQKADFLSKRKTFREWKEKKLKGLKMPLSYDFGTGEIAPLTDYALCNAAGNEGYWDSISFMYDWGFKRGIAYQKKRKKA